MKEIHSPTDDGYPSFLPCSLLKSDNLSKLIKTTCLTSDEFLTTSHVSEMSGLHLCIVYVRDEFYKTRTTTPLMLAICLQIHIDGDDVDKVGLNKSVIFLTLHLRLHRRLMSSFELRKNEYIFVRLLYCITSYKRMYCAMQQLGTLPKQILRVIFGNDYESDEKSQAFNRCGMVITLMSEGVDSGSFKYIHPSYKHHCIPLHDSQYLDITKTTNHRELCSSVY